MSGTVGLATNRPFIPQNRHLAVGRHGVVTLSPLSDFLLHIEYRINASAFVFRGKFHSAGGSLSEKASVRCRDSMRSLRRALRHRGRRDYLLENGRSSASPFYS